MDAKLKIVLNPSSGQGRGERFVSRLRSMLTAEGIEAEILVSRSEAHLRELFRELAAKEALLVAVGGDSTFTFMAQELWRVKEQSGRDVAEMAWIGVGTANDILRQPGLGKAKTAVSALKSGSTQEITLGELIDERGEKEIFLGTVALGAAPRVNEAIARARLRGRKGGVFAEWLPGLSSLRKAFAQGDLPLAFELDPLGGRGLSGSASLILLLNIPHFSRGIVVNNFASLESEFIDWTVLSCPSLASLWRMQQRMSRTSGGVIHEDIQVGQSREGRLLLHTPQPYLVDGELRGSVRELAYRALPQALRLRVPRIE